MIFPNESRAGLTPFHASSIGELKRLLGVFIIGDFNQVHVWVTKVYRCHWASCAGSLNWPINHRNAT